MGIATRAGIAKAGGASGYVQGMDSMTEMLSFLQSIGGKIAGAIMASKPRTDGGPTNADLIEYLAEPVNGPSRDVRPTEQDHTDAAAIMKAAIVKKLQMMSKKGKPLKAWNEARRAKFAANGKIEAEKIAAFGLRKAGNMIKDRMVQRLNSGLEPPTSEAYANWRQKKYGVPTSAALKATGQLASNINDGHIKLITKPELMTIISGYADDLTSLILR